MNTLRALFGMSSETEHHQEPSPVYIGQSSVVVGNGDVVDLGTGNTALVRSAVHIGTGAVCVLDDGNTTGLYVIKGSVGVELVPTDRSIPEQVELVAEGGEWNEDVISVWRDSNDDIWVSAGNKTWMVDEDNSTAVHILLRTIPSST